MIVDRRKNETALIKPLVNKQIYQLTKNILVSTPIDWSLSLKSGKIAEIRSLKTNEEMEMVPKLNFIYLNLDRNL